MSKIDTQKVKEKVVDMMMDLKNIMTIYADDRQKIAGIEENAMMAREYKDSQIAEIREKTLAAARKEFDALQSHFEELAEALRDNDNIYDFSDPEFAACIALMSTSPKPLPIETILGIVDKFMGNRQALLALAEVAKGANETTIRERIFNSESEIDTLQDRLISLDVGFPENIIALPVFRDALLKIAKACGQELTDQEKDLGTGYQDLVNMQVRAAFGL